MQRTRFDQMSCPIARGLERVGEWWSMLIMRDTLAGITRFEPLARKLGIAPNMLTRRLAALVEAGLLERRPYSEHPPRFEYVPTACGRDLEPVLLALLAWGNRHFTPEGPRVRVVEAATGRVADPVLTDRATGREVRAPEFVLAAAPHPAGPDAPGARAAPADPGHPRPGRAGAGTTRPAAAAPHPTSPDAPGARATTARRRARAGQGAA